MNRIGEVLKEARSKRSISLDDVHAKIKIHPRVLQLLEEGKFDKLPSPLFVKSFLRSYAEFLEVNPEDLLRSYENEALPKEPEQVLFLKTADEKLQKPASQQIWNIVIIASLTLIVLLGGYYALKYGRQWLPQQAKKAAAPKAAAAAAVQAPKKSSDWLRSPELGNFPSISKSTPLSLKIKAVDNVWMRITADGQVVYQSILKKGQDDTWQARKEYEIWTGNSSNMALTLNKIFIGSPGKGVIKKMIISHEGVRVLPSNSN